MLDYIIRRLILLPLTLFSILLINFIIINLAPGDPVSVTEVSAEGLATRKQDKAVAFGSDDRYLQFREHYGLTLPVLWNTWPWITQEEVLFTLQQLTTHKINPSDTSSQELSSKEYDALRIRFGDQSRFLMPKLIAIIQDEQQPIPIRQMAIRFFLRGATRQAYLGSGLTEEQKTYNRKLAKDQNYLQQLLATPPKDTAALTQLGNQLAQWLDENNPFYQFDLSTREKWYAFFFETRFIRYMSRVILLDFGTLRNDPNRTVISEVTKRFKYSLTLAILPMLITFVLCQIFGFIMAYKHNRWPDFTLNYLFLILYAIPIFVVAPFLIENIALNNTFPFTSIPIPTSGFTSPEAIYAEMTSWQRFWDVMQHIAIPLLAILYGSLAAEARLSRTAILEVMRYDYVRTAAAKGLGPSTILFKHVGRNASITIVTSIAGSLGVILGGSLIVETLFEIHGFGKFFYDAIINRDYNVIMFSAIAGSFLSLLGYLIADLAYTWLDPRVTLD